MRRLIFVLAFGLAAGCGGGDNQKPDNQQQPQQQPQAQPKPQPQAQPQPKPQPKPQPAQPANTADASNDASNDDGPIVIKGPRKSSSSSSSSGTPSSGDDEAKRKKIEELKAAARASQGQDNGGPYREGTDTPSTGNDANASKKQALRDQMAQDDTKIKALQDEKAAMAKKERTEGRYGGLQTVYDDPDRAKAIDTEVDELKKHKDLCQRQIFEIDNPSPKGGGGTSSPGAPTPPQPQDAPK
jgi:hypothetical protein